MSSTLKEIHDIFFPHSLYVTDRYHFIRQVLWAFENIRKREQKVMSKKERIFFKRSRSLLKKRMEDLTEEKLDKVIIMLEKNDAIRQGYLLKESFYRYVLSSTTREEAEKALDQWIQAAKDSKDSAWKAAIRAFQNWKPSILNSFLTHYTNGYLEGIHNRIKTLKRVCFRMGNFDHFRTRILLILK